MPPPPALVLVPVLRPQRREPVVLRLPQLHPQQPALWCRLQSLAVPPLPSRQSFSAAMAGSTASTRGNVRAGTEIKVATERPTMSLTLTEMDAGSWVIFELPGFSTAASGTQQSSLDALRKASDTSYFKDKDALWVKVVSNGNGARGPIGGGPGAGTSLQVSR